MLEDALSHPQQSGQQGHEEEAQFTQLAPANPIHLSSNSNAHLHLQIPEDEQQQPYMEANTDACKVYSPQADILRILHLSWDLGSDLQVPWSLTDYSDLVTEDSCSHYLSLGVQYHYIC